LQSLQQENRNRKLTEKTSSRAQRKCSGDKGGEKENKQRQDINYQSRVAVHCSNKRFKLWALWLTISSSLLRKILQSCELHCSPSKISLFLAVEIVQIRSITATMKNSEFNWSLRIDTTDGKLELSGISSPIIPHHCLANGQSGNKWSELSSTARLQSSQL
jgi:hypothetical protein